MLEIVVQSVMVVISAAGTANGKCPLCHRCASEIECEGLYEREMLARLLATVPGEVSGSELALKSCSGIAGRSWHVHWDTRGS